MPKPRSLRRLKKAVLPFFRSTNSLWYEKDLSQGWPDVPAAEGIRPDLDDREGTLNWLRSFSEPWMNNPREIAVGRQEGHFFPNIKIDGQIVAYSKIGIRRVFIDDFGLCVDVPEGIAFLYHIYVVKEHRKKEIAKYLLMSMLRELRDRGYRKMFCHIEKWNKPSILLFESLGFRGVADISFYRIGGTIRLWRCRSLRDRRLTLTTRMPPVLR